MKISSPLLQGKLDLILDAVSDGILVTNEEGIIQGVNQRVLHMFGYHRQSKLIGQHINTVINESDRAKVQQRLIRAGPGRRSCLCHFLKADGTGFPGDIKVTPIRDNTAKPIAWLVVINDITERALAHQALRQHRHDLITLNRVAQSFSKSKDFNAMLGKALDSVLDYLNVPSGALYLLNGSQGTFTLATYKGINVEFAKLLKTLFMGQEAVDEIRDAQRPVTLTDLDGNQSQPTVKAASGAADITCLLNIALKSRGKTIGIISVPTCREEATGWLEMSLLETIGGQIGVAIENSQWLQKSEEQSITDELTGLFNRHHFWKILETEIYRAQRYTWSMSLVMLDIDHLKEYNDRFGHIGGDHLIQSLAKILISQLRKTDVSFRLGGDEFAIILPDTTAARAWEIMTRVHFKWRQGHQDALSGTEIPIGFSAGIAELPLNAETQDGLAFLADAALYFAKKSGGRRCALVSELASLSSPNQLSYATAEQVYALLTTIDSKESFGFGHHKRVATIAESIGGHIGLQGREMESLQAAAMLHDLGKIGITKEILNKSDKLTSQEWTMIKKHTAEGAKIIGQIGLLAHLAPIIRHHHEWFDGAGYPDSLKGEAIPLAARIIAVADAYDSMTTRRPYKEAMSPAEALQELAHSAGTQFDPALVEAATSLLEARIPEKTL